MKKYNYGITEDIAKWLISQKLSTNEEILNCDEYDAALMIDCYNVCHNKKCLVYSKMIESKSGGKMFDSVIGYLHENYDTAKEREYIEKDDLMNQEI